jgi:hypothetical protein
MLLGLLLSYYHTPRICPRGRSRLHMPALIKAPLAKYRFPVFLDESKYECMSSRIWVWSEIWRSTKPAGKNARGVWISLLVTMAAGLTPRYHDLDRAQPWRVPLRRRIRGLGDVLILRCAAKSALVFFFWNGEGIEHLFYWRTHVERANPKWPMRWPCKR